MPTCRLSTWACSAPPSSVCEDLDRLVGRADRLVELRRVLTGTILSFPPCVTSNGQRMSRPRRKVKALRDLDRLVLRLASTTQRNWKLDWPIDFGIGLGLLLDAGLPGGEVPVQRAQRHAGCEAVIAGGDAGGIVAAEGIAEDGDALFIDIVAGRARSRRRRRRAPRNRSGCAGRAGEGSRPAPVRRRPAC